LNKVRGHLFDLLVIGTSQGGFKALSKVLGPLPVDFSVPILVVRHQPADSDDYLLRSLSQTSQLKVKFAEDGDRPNPGTVYLAPPDRHLLINDGGVVQLSAAERVNFSRPAIDPLFISAANCFGPSVLAAVLTGANSDGAKGVMAIKKMGGKVIVQDPASAEADAMPKAALQVVDADYIVWLDQIGPLCWTLTKNSDNDG
jgi:two-component system, chemotaxis family, protein-glutamate methylesterase/glutaminase